MLSITIKMTVSIMATSITAKISCYIIKMHSMTLNNAILSITKTAIFSIITVSNAILSTTPYNYAESNLFTISQKGRLS